MGFFICKCLFITNLILWHDKSLIFNGMNARLFMRKYLLKIKSMAYIYNFHEKLI